MTDLSTRLTLVVCLVAAFAVIGGCSDVVDTASDCTTDEYFDETRDLCRTCPAIVVPECPLDCGYSLMTDTRGCQVAACECGVCEAEEFFDRNTLSCTACAESTTPACREGCPEVGTTTDDLGCTQTVCECACPENDAPDCGAEGCCGTTSQPAGDGCSVTVCDCPEEAPAGFYYDAEAVCQACDGDNDPESCP